MSQVKNILTNHNYVVRAKKHNDGVILKLPKTLHSPSKTISYRIKRGKKSGLFFNDNFLSIPEYAIRLLCLLDIYKGCGFIGYSHFLIDYLDKDDNLIGETSIVDDSESEIERTKESFLMDIYIRVATEGISNDIEIFAKEKDVLAGYKMLLEIMGY